MIISFSAFKNKETDEFPKIEKRAINTPFQKLI